MAGGTGAEAKDKGLLEPGKGGRGSTKSAAPAGAPAAAPQSAGSSAPPAAKKPKTEAGVEDVVMGDGAAAHAVNGGFGARFAIGKAPRLSQDPAPARRTYPIRFDGGAEGLLSVTERSLKFDFELVEASTLNQAGARTPQLRYSEDEDRVLFPVFMPSAGREKTARLNLHATMQQDSVADWGYVQIVCVKRCELDGYVNNWPELNFFALPESADSLGIGASRHWLLHLARLLCPREFYFAFVMDDNVRSWKAVPMNPQDGALDGARTRVRLRLAGPCVRPRCSSPALSYRRPCAANPGAELFQSWKYPLESNTKNELGPKKDLPLREILKYFQAADFRESDPNKSNLHKFGMIGFDRFGRPPTATRNPYARRHVYKVRAVMG